jgi:lysozyme
MRYSLHGIELTKRFESCRLNAYQDTGGVWTIGWGHTGPEVIKGFVITQARADEYLLSDIQIAVVAVNSNIKIQLTQNEFDALVDFVYNVGVQAFKKSTLLSLINQGRLYDASKEFDRWVFDNGKKIRGLVNRRNDEEVEFRGG